MELGTAAIGISRVRLCNWSAASSVVEVLGLGDHLLLVGRAADQRRGVDRASTAQNERNHVSKCGEAIATCQRIEGIFHII